MKQYLVYLGGPLTLLFVWCLCTYTGKVGSLFLPTPDRVFFETAKLFSSGGIYPDIFSTCLKVLSSIVLAMTIGIPSGLILGFYPKVYSFFEVVIDFFRSLPGSSLFPLFILLFGIGDAPKVAVAVFVVSLVLLINTVYGVHNVPQLRVTVGKVFRASEWQIFKEVIIPSILPQIFVGLRIGLSLSMLSIVITEMFIGSKYGLGQKIYDSYLTYRIPSVYAYILITGLLGFLLNRLVILIEKRVVHWTGV